MATQYIVDPDAPPPPGGYPTPYINTPSSPSNPLPGHGFSAPAPQMAPRNPTGGFPQISPGFAPGAQPSSMQPSGQFPAPGFQQPRATGAFEQLSSAGMMSPGFQQPAKTTGAFEQLSSAGMMSPGFQQPAKTTGAFGQISSAGMTSPGFQQPAKTTGAFGQISSAGMMSPGFQQPALAQNPVNNPAHIKKVRIRYAVAASGCGAILGFLLGVMNSALQGWEVSQGMPQILILTALFALGFAAIGYLRRERVDELLAQADLPMVTEFLNRPSLTKATPPAPARVIPPTGSFQQPANTMYPRAPSGTFNTTDPDSTDEFSHF